MMLNILSRTGQPPQGRIVNNAKIKSLIRERSGERPLPVTSSVVMLPGWCLWEALSETLPPALPKSRFLHCIFSSPWSVLKWVGLIVLEHRLWSLGWIGILLLLSYMTLGKLLNLSVFSSFICKMRVILVSLF